MGFRGLSVCLVVFLAGVALSGQTSPPPPSGSAVYNVRVVTDASPDLTDLGSFVNSVTTAWPSTDEKVWALFYWSHILKRQTSPMVLHGFDVTDPIRNLNDYGYTMCSTASGMNQSFYELLGLRHQYWDICNHTVSAVEYDGAFHMIDTSMSNLVTTDDGHTLASVPDVAASGARLLKEHSLYATSANGFLTGTDTGRNLTASAGTTASSFADDFCESGLKYRDYYYNWNAGHRYVLNLRDDDVYTRYYRPLGTTPEFWVPSEKVDAPDPAHTQQIDAANKFGLRGNGSWSFTPPLSADAWARAVYSSANIVAAGGGLSPAPGQAAEVIYKVQAANAIASQEIDAQFARTDAAATAIISLSINHGRTWQEVGSVGATVGNAVPLAVKLQAEVAAAYETLVRIRMTAADANSNGVALTGLAINTITQVNARALPKLNIGSNTVFVGAGDQSDSLALWPDLRADLWKKDVYDSSNITSQPIGVPRRYTAVVYPSVLAHDAYLTYKLDAPTNVTRLVYGGRLFNASGGSYIDFLHSFDGGATWIRLYRLTDTTLPHDVIHYETISGIPAGVRSVLVRYLMHTTGTTTLNASGLYAVRMELNHQPLAAAGRPIDVTFRWKEVQADRTLVDRSHRQRVSTFPFTYKIDVGGSDHPVMESMKINLEDPADSTLYGYNDGRDVGGEKDVPMKRTEGVNRASGKPYTVSRAPSGFQGSPGATNTTILTDGVVGSPVTGGAYYLWGQCWTPGTNVDLQVDLGSTQMVAAFRAHMFGYQFWDALKGEVQDRVEILTSTDGAAFASQGTLQTSLWKKDLPVNYMLQDDERATGWNFEQTIPSAVAARYVRFHVTPKRNLCISELQVLDSVTYQPFDLRVSLPAGASPPQPTNLPPSVSLTAPLSGASFTAPAAITIVADARDSDGAIRRVDFFSGTTLVGSATAAPFSVTWSTIATGSYVLTAKATDFGGATTTSSPITVTVAAAVNLPPRVTLTAPAAGASFPAPATLTLAADASDPDGGVARVEFFAGTTSIGLATSAPYRATWSNIAAGAYSLTAVVTDSGGATARSPAIPVTITLAPSTIDEIVLYAAANPVIIGGWNVTTDASAASGARLQNPDAGVPKPAAPRASPTLAFDLTFDADSGKAYRLWMRGKALADSYNNDSVYVQFDGSVDESGAPVWRTNTTSATTVILEDCSGCGVHGWGWADNGYGAGVFGPLVRFAQSGPQTIRVQAREDGLGIDQIVLSAAAYLTVRPGALQNDTTILPATAGSGTPPPNASPLVTLIAPAAGGAGSAPASITLTAAATDSDGTIVTVDFFDGPTQIARTTSSPYTITWPLVAAGTYALTAVATDDRAATTRSLPVSITIAPRTSGGAGVNEIVLYPGADAQVGGGWSFVADTTAAGGVRLQNPDAKAPKVATPAAAPAQFFDLTFNADAGKPYRLWMRGKAMGDDYNNDSVYVQFDNSVDVAGHPIWRTQTTSATTLVLEDCTNCGVHGWGWNDNGYGANTLGQVVYFATSGPQRLRVQTREDGLGIDQIVLSAVRYLTTAPGATRDDTTIVAR